MGLSGQQISCTTDGAVTEIVIDNPPVNALSLSVACELGDAIERLADRGETRCALIRAEGAHFCAGADLKETLCYGGEDAVDLIEKVNCALDKVAQAPFPIIAVVQGPAFGGGLEVALCCDMIVASHKAAFGFPEVTLGAVPVYGGMRRLPRAVGNRWAKRLVLTGESIDAKTAERIGLVQKVVPQEELLAESRRMANVISERGPVAVRVAKQLLDEAQDGSCGKAYAQLESDYFRLVLQSEDRAEGVEAFFQKRAPRFKGR